MHQDATWHGGRPQPRQLVLDGDPALPLTKRGGTPNFSAEVYCGQTAAWIKMPLGKEVGLGLRGIVLNGTQLPPEKGAHPSQPNFWSMSIVAKWLDG